MNATVCHRHLRRRSPQKPVGRNRLIRSARVWCARLGDYTKCLRTHERRWRLQNRKLSNCRVCGPSAAHSYRWRHSGWDSPPPPRRGFEISRNDDGETEGNSRDEGSRGLSSFILSSCRRCIMQNIRVIAIHKPFSFFFVRTAPLLRAFFRRFYTSTFSLLLSLSPENI